MGQCCGTDKDNDISKDIKIIRHSDTSSKYPLSNLFDDDINTFWYSDGIQDIFYMLDIGEGGSIETLELTFSPNLYCSSMRFLVPLNNDPYDDDPKNWKQIIKKNKMKNGYNQIQFDPTNADHQHFRYIKLSFDTIKGTSIAGGGQLAVEKLKVYGTCGKIIKKQKTKLYLEQNIFNVTSKIKVISNSDAFSSSDDIQNIYNDSISYWSSSKVAKDGTVWIIFDCDESILQEIECVFHTKYVCKTISIETSDDNQHFEQIPGLKEKSIKQLVFDKDTETKHKRYIKIVFNDIPKNYLCLSQIKFYGKHPNAKADEKEEQDVEEKKEEKEEEDEDEDVQYSDITCCFSINLVRDCGSFDHVNFDVKNILSTVATTYWASPNRAEMKSDDKDIYLIFDVDQCYIHRIETMYCHNKDMHCNTIKIYTADDIEGAQWNMIGEQQHSAFAELNRIKLKPHKRYIKLLLDDLEDIRFGALSYVKFIGTEPKDKEDVTLDIKPCDTSLTQMGTDVEDVFKPNDKMWASANSEQAFIVFDCNCYEIQRVKIKFVRSESKCGTIRIAMSDVKNVYNFKEDKMVIDLLENDPERKQMIEEIVFDDIYSKHGFHRYIMLRFDDNISNVAIQQIRFYGVKSDNIPDEILYELERQKSALSKLALEDEDGAIKFGDLPIKLVSNSAAFVNPQFKIENLWNDEQNCWCSESKLNKVYFTFDLDKYKVKQLEITLNAQYPCKVCTIFTGDTKNKKEMKSICRKDKFDEDPEDIQKPRVIELKENHERFIRMEFTEMKADFFGAERFKFVGDGLDKETRELTIDDLYDGCDEDLIHEYLKQLQKRQATEMAQASKIDSEIIQKDGNDLGSKEWEDHKKKSLQIPVKYLYLISEGNSKLCRTKFEEEEHMRFATKQRELKQKAADNQFAAEVEGMKRLKVSKVKIEKTMQEYQKLMADGHQMRAQMKFMEYQAMMQQEQAAQNQMFQAMQDDNQKLIDLFGEKNKKQVFDEWCNSIDNQPMILSSKYNVKQYEDCAGWGINKFDKEEVVARHKKLADLLDETFERKTQKMHKFHMFLLSTTYHYAREPGFDKTCWLLLDCADATSDIKQIDYIEFQFQSALQCKSVKIYSSATYDDTESKTTDGEDKWSGFELISTKQIIEAGGGGMQQMMQMMMAAQMGQAAAQMGMDTSYKIPLNGKHSRYIKIEFCDFLTGQFVGVQRLKIYAAPVDDTWYNEDFQLKIVAESTKFNSVSGAINIYKKDSDYFWRTRSEHGAGHVIFQTDKKQITRMEIVPEKGYPPGKITIYQSDSGDKDTKWKVVCEKDKIDADGLNVIQFKSPAKEKYIKVEVTQTNDDLSYMGISFMKFYGETKSKLYNIASQVPIVSNSGTFADPNIVINNMYTADESVWMNLNQQKNPSKDMENKIRDTLCETLNKLRNGGDIRHDDKHFCKFLLCWILQTHYDEVLSTAKSVMSILRKPLDEEYQRLTDIQSPILSLSLSPEHKVAENVKSNREVLEPTYSHWYKFRKAMFWPNDLQKIGEEWIKIGLCETMPQFKDIRRLSFPLEEKEEAKDFTDCDELAMDFLNRIAANLDKSFQNAMKTAFDANREQMNLKPLATELGVLSGPIKTKSRQAIKIKLDYNDAPHPRCMSVLDIIRCAIICETDEELVSLHNLLCTQFSGKILRTKNAFDAAIENKTYGYRAVLMNIVYGDEAILPKEYQMICEVQLILSKYYEIRKKMHLGYTICRSQEGGIAEKKKPNYVLAEDCCKFGKLDI